jgi:glutamyl-Q tRNA(Asp) synthetase
VIGRFAPSTTGAAHPGTLLAALLCWLDARSQRGQVLLRLENLDPERCRPEWSARMREDLAWLGLTFDAVMEQSDASARHEAALDRLAGEGRLYPCACTRSSIRAVAEPAKDGGQRYPGTCRGRALPATGWRSACEPLRVRLESGGRFGDPVVRRRDGAPAYHLASVVDDAAAGVTRIVRGRDLAPHMPLQNALRDLLGLPQPEHHHHLLLLEERGGKLAKLHGAVGAAELRRHYTAPELCGFLAHAAGLLPAAVPTTPEELLTGFGWERVGTEDRLVRWQPPRLTLVESGS